LPVSGNQWRRRDREHETAGIGESYRLAAARRARTIQTESTAQGAGCTKISVLSAGRGSFSLDIPFYRTSYIDRLNLTIRQGSAYLCRRSLCHARRTQRLEDHLELLRCHYNFVRPHRALKFGHEVRTPAMQAGLTKQRLTFRDIFTSISKFLRLVFIKVNCVIVRQVYSTVQEDFVTSMAA
jgi:hypothetical protein